MVSRNNTVDWLKWFAIGTMFLDHLRYIPSDYTEGLFYIGRAAYPIFAILCGYNIIVHSKAPHYFTCRVGALGIILVCLQPLTPQGFWPLNPIITLTLGLALCIPATKNFKGKEYHVALSGLVGCLVGLVLNQALPIGDYIAYSWSGVVMVLLGAIYGLTVRHNMSPSINYLLIFLVIACAFSLNTYDLFSKCLGTTWALITIICLKRDVLPRCPLPNNYWLYIAFPASMIAPVAYYLLYKNS